MNEDNEILAHIYSSISIYIDSATNVFINARLPNRCHINRHCAITLSGNA